MRRSIATVSLSGNLEEKLAAIAAAKFDAVEIFENDLLFFDGTARDVRRMADELGLKIVLFQPFRDFEAVPETQFRRNLDRAERKFDLMDELGAKMILVCSSVSPLAVDDDDLAAAQLHELAERAAARGIKVGYEALMAGELFVVPGKMNKALVAARRFLTQEAQAHLNQRFYEEVPVRERKRNRGDVESAAARTADSLPTR